MKKFMLLLLGLAAATLSPAAGTRVFVLSSAGDVDPALVDQVRARLEQDSGAVVRLAPPLPLEPGQSLEAIGRAAEKTLGKDDFAIIVLTRPTDEQPQGVCLPQFRFAVLNVARLEVGADPAQLVRRTGQEGVRVMAMLLGLSQCPFPLCVLVGYQNVEDLDHMSQNYCPPCQDRFTRLANEAGIRLVEPAEDAPAEPPLAVESAEEPDAAE